MSGDFKIPEGYIEDAETYSILPSDTKVPIHIGGKIMMNLVVREQMSRDNIIATTGLKEKACLIIVSYTWKEVVIMFNNARKHIEKWADKQARDELQDIKDESEN